ncbi:hypothetical protein K3888_09230 [Dietzia aurantiaca]|uniref:P-loop ATPase, Sll1717 family n=1 Tax=Dietzia aurantiaca TaxID=983873 RepID=UPI001E390C82|nr:hypothetical protein [Dietzia aurantiaca]MCD2262885.1 hypothetical protein [Dietzia aurantiaca]
MKELIQIDSFGAIDADADELLRDCFEDHPAYLQIRAQQRFLVLGRKGAGKTAIYKRLVTEQSFDQFAFGYSFDDYPWAHHKLQEETGVPVERRYIHSWKYLILIALAKILLNQDQSQPWSDDAHEALSRLEAFMVDSYGSRNPDMTQLFSPERILQLKGRLNLGAIAGDLNSIRVRDLPIHIQDVNRMLASTVMSTLNPSISYFICFDQLDLGFDPEDSSYSARLSGLIMAARDLFIQARDENKNFCPAIFLRDDIFEDLKFEDKNKIAENYSTRVIWSDTGSSPTLKELMEKRFTIALSETEHSDHVHWNDVFDETKEMPSRQNKYKHICDRTFLRPRDMIKFCNTVLTAHKAGPPESQFNNSSIHEAREEYSDYLLRELDDEVAKHSPNFSVYLEVLKSIGTEQFSLEQFESNLELRTLAVDESTSSAMATLFEFSVVSYLKPGGRGGGSAWIWRYKDPRARFDPSSSSFRVHPGLKEALDLARG